MVQVLREISGRVRSGCEELGGIIQLAGQSFYVMLFPPYRFDQIFAQMRSIGVQSMFIILLTGLFTGMVLGLQSGRAFRQFGAESLTGAVAGLSLARELAPVLSGLMITARAGSAMAAELGSMRVTQQIDALVSMAVSPISYLVVPRLLATIFMLPLLTALFDFVGILGTYLVGVQLLAIDEGTFLFRIKWFVDAEDILQGLFKSVCFGFLIAAISCFKGLHASGGAKGVGLATTRSVVYSSVAILVGDYFLTAIVFKQ